MARRRVIPFSGGNPGKCEELALASVATIAQVAPVGGVGSQTLDSRLKRE